MTVSVERVFVQQMKTKWGSCNHRAGSIRLNTDLARKPRECLEYIVVHEMVHLLEPTHNERFIALMDQCMPFLGIAVSSITSTASLPPTNLSAWTSSSVSTGVASQTPAAMK